MGQKHIKVYMVK